MKKFGAIIISLIILAMFILIAWWLYRNFHTTPMLVGNLLIILTGVLISYTAYSRLSLLSDDVVILSEEDYPEIEEGLIYASVDDFANKHEKVKGTLFIAGLDITEKELNLVDVSYKKLTDEITFKFSPSTSIKLKGVATIAVGDHQFLVYGFEEGVVRQNGVHRLTWLDNKLQISTKNKDVRKIKIPAKMPTIAFNWPSFN